MVSGPKECIIDTFKRSNIHIDVHGSVTLAIGTTLEDVKIAVAHRVSHNDLALGTGVRGENRPWRGLHCHLHLYPMGPPTTGGDEVSGALFQWETCLVVQVAGGG